MSIKLQIPQGGISTISLEVGVTNVDGAYTKISDIVAGNGWGRRCIIGNSIK